MEKEHFVQNHDNKFSYSDEDSSLDGDYKLDYGLNHLYDDALWIKSFKNNSF